MAMIYKKTGTVQITDDLTLQDPFWKISWVRDHCESSTAFIDVTLWETLYEHNRVFTYSYTTDGDWTRTEIVNHILSLTPFTGSVLQ